jgi:NAD(P)-dependent dehydrogenase (short-subunit alcohol dehydrogenase family)
MTIDFSDKHVAITGGANGIGLATARTFAEAGASISILDMPAERPAEIAQSIGGRGFEADVTDRNSLEKAFAAIGELDVVVINAGIAPAGSILDTAPSDWQRTLAVNLTGAFHTLQISARRMEDRRHGSIVLVASTNSYDGEPDLLAYNASKAGLLGLLHTAANELGPFGIRVNAVCPGLIRTRLTKASFSNPEILSQYFRHIPLGRGGEPEEVARAVLFLASDLATYITGTTLLVDGGQMASKFGTWDPDQDSFNGQQWTRKLLL